jgi:hypothetical protein
MPTELPKAIMLDASRLNERLLGGHQLAITEAGGEVIGCEVVFMNESVPPDLFDSYLAGGLIQELEQGCRFKISVQGRKALR